MHVYGIQQHHWHETKEAHLSSNNSLYEFPHHLTAMCSPTPCPGHEQQGQCTMPGSLASVAACTWPNGVLAVAFVRYRHSERHGEPHPVNKNTGALEPQDGDCTKECDHEGFSNASPVHPRPNVPTA